jgi:ferredoxin--NADP+ reductase
VDVEATLGSESRPLRVAIIGAGPAAFYAAEALLKQADLSVRIDMFNRFPTPFGLVREGVAPDHQSIKAVTRVYDKIAGDARVRYFGNVTFGVDVEHAELKQCYDQIIYAVGAQSDRKMGIPGEELEGSYPATIFVGWYNGHPDYSELFFDLSHERAIVVGNGNVAMDVTRILASSAKELAQTDMADDAIALLGQSKVREVVMLGRRGPVQAAFTTPELKEFGELDGVDVLVDPRDLELDEASEAELATNKTAQKNFELLRKYAAQQSYDQPRRIVMKFLASPVEVIGENGRVRAVKIERNELVPDGKGSLKARGTGQYATLEAGLILRSVGYKGVPLAGVPFDELRAVIRNVAGRVCDTSDTPIPGEYVVGWAKRGPSGVIGTNKPDSVATVAAMVADLASLPGIDDTQRDPERIVELLRSKNVDFVSYSDWKRLDKHETERGAEQGRPRVKATSVDEMLSLIRKWEG